MSRSRLSATPSRSVRRSWSGPGAAGRTPRRRPLRSEQIIVAEVDASGPPPDGRALRPQSPRRRRHPTLRALRRAHARGSRADQRRDERRARSRRCSRPTIPSAGRARSPRPSSSVDRRYRRTLSTPGRVAAAEMVAMIRVVSETADDITISADDVLVLRADGLVVRRTVAGKERVGGGAFENPLIALWLFDAAGLLDAPRAVRRRARRGRARALRHAFRSTYGDAGGRQAGRARASRCGQIAPRHAERRWMQRSQLAIPTHSRADRRR